MIAPESKNDRPLLMEPQSNLSARIASEGRRTRDDEVCEVKRAAPTKRRRITKHVSWAKKAHVHLLPPNRKSFKDYRDEDVWYTRNDYEDFLIDRLRTIERLRASGGNDKALDQDNFCVRGLEPFQSPGEHEELFSKRRCHQSTILIEQVRQSMYGMRNPERFRLMVETQSAISERRARELAAVDEHAVHGSVSRRGSLLSTNNFIGASKDAGSIQSGLDSGDSMSLTQRIRELQESNARRLIEIYSQPGYNPFRFPIRRDSLLAGGSSDMRNVSLMNNRFPIRRDSLTPIGATGLS